MRVFFAILLLSVAASSSLVKLGIVAWYECNKTYIAQNLCENRDKPQLKCCGKCYLRKQLTKAEGRHDNLGKPLPAQLSKFELSLFVLPNVPVIAWKPVAGAGIKHSPYAFPFAAGILLSVLHPPG